MLFWIRLLDSGDFNGWRDHLSAGCALFTHHHLVLVDGRDPFDGCSIMIALLVVEYDHGHVGYHRRVRLAHQ